MPSFLATDIEARARAAADSHDNYVDQTMVWAWLNREVQKLDMMAARKGLPLVRASTDITATGASSYVVAATPDVMASIGVYEVDISSGQGTRLRRLARADQIDLPPYYAAPKASSYNLYLNASRDLVLELFPAATGTYRLFYVPEPTKITTGAETLRYPAGWEELLVLGVAISMLAREETSNPVLERQYRDELARIDGEMTNRELAESAAVRNVDALYPHDDWTTYPTVIRGEMVYF